MDFSESPLNKRNAKAREKSRAFCFAKPTATSALFSGSDNRYIVEARFLNIVYPRSMNAAAFLSWTEGREERYELARGRVMMMTGGLRAHAVIVRR
jgi:hypothetical protein